MEEKPKKYISSWIAWSIIALAVGITGFASWYQWNQIDTITSSMSISVVKKSATTAKTATDVANTDWKTYTNDTYGFSFKYPKDWVVSEIPASATSNPGVALASPATVSNRSQWEAPQNDINITYAATVATDVVNVLNKLGATTIDDYVTKNNELTKIGTVNLGEVKGIDTIANGMAAYYNIYVVKNNHLYNVFFNTVPSKDKLTDTDNQILSTFQFTK